jgi:hypothetical protein
LSSAVNKAVLFAIFLFLGEVHLPLRLCTFSLNFDSFQSLYFTITSHSLYGISLLDELALVSCVEFFEFNHDFERFFS